MWIKVSQRLPALNQPVRVRGQFLSLAWENAKLVEGPFGHEWRAISYRGTVSPDEWWDAEISGPLP